MGGDPLDIAFVNQPWARAAPPSESIAILVEQLATRLAAADDVRRVRVYSRREPAEPPREVDGVEHRFVAAVNDWRLLKVLNRMPRRATRPAFTSRLYYPDFVRRVGADLRHEPADIVHMSNLPSYVPVLRRAAPDALLVLHMNCSWLSQLHPAVLRRRLPLADVILGCADHVTGDIVRAWPALADRCRTLVNGVDVDAFTPPAGERRFGKRLVTLSRISPEKGLHVLAEAFNTIAERHPDVALTVIGEESLVPPEMLVEISADPAVRALLPFYDRSYLEQVKERLTPAGAARVEWAGALAHDDVAPRLHDADVFVTPSLSDAMPLPPVEAMAAGLPVIASRVGGLAEIVDDGVTGILVEPGDVGALVEALDRILSDEALRSSMAAEARRQAVERFSWDTLAAQLLNLYRAEVDRRRFAMKSS